MLQGLLLIGGDGLPGLLQTRQRDLQIGRRPRLPAIETVGVIDQGRIAARADLADHLVDHLIDGAVGDRLPGQKGVELLLEIRIRGVQFSNISHLSGTELLTQRTRRR